MIGIIYYPTLQVSFRSECWLRLFLWFSTIVCITHNLKCHHNFCLVFSILLFPFCFPPALQRRERYPFVYSQRTMVRAAAALLLKINLFLSLGEKSIRLSSISLFPWNKGKSFKTLLTMMMRMQKGKEEGERWHLLRKNLQQPSAREPGRQKLFCISCLRFLISLWYFKV